MESVRRKRLLVGVIFEAINNIFLFIGNRYYVASAEHVDDNFTLILKARHS